jgi:hypothetical protein
MTTIHNYRATDSERRIRLKALETALHHVRRNYTRRDQKFIAAEELIGYGVFTSAQIAGWLGLGAWVLEGYGAVKAWGTSALTHEQLETAVALAKAGINREKPKALVYEAHINFDMSFNVIGGLLGVHKNTVRRIIRRLENEPWS